jgi:hypothetical protein
LARNPGDVQVERPQRDNEFDRTFDLFSGNRAVSENLQLNRAFVVNSTGEQVAIDTLEGITVAAMDWKAKLVGKNPQLDPLASLIPEDQHALFFPTFQAMTDFIDQLDAQATPILQTIEPHGEDAQTRARYQKQLCLEVSEIARLFGPQMIDSVAMTGGDPYLRIGSDVMILFAAKNVEAVKTFISAKHALAAAKGAATVSAIADGLDYAGVVSDDRAVCSYVAVVDQVVVVTNSLKQLEAIQRAKTGKNLAELDEYRFFRDRYAKGDQDELAFLVMSDAAIRRWCSPRWRIADSRRTRALAVLSEIQVRHLSDIATGAAPTAIDTAKLPLEGLGEIAWSVGGVHSSVFNTVGFMTPINELDLKTVSKEEAEAYKRFRDNYQNRWGGWFDPIAVRFSKRPTGLAVDGTIMPLILGTEYSDFTEIIGGAQLTDQSGDRHSGTLFHLICAIDRDSRQMRQATTFAGGMGLQADPLSWLGNSWEFYAEDDPVWKELGGELTNNQSLEKNLPRLPIALRAAVAEPLKLAIFLTALRGFADQSAPGLTKWDTLDHNGQPYVRIGAAGAGLGDNFALYYAVTPTSFVLSVNEALIKRVLDRQKQPLTPEQLAALPPWQGKSMNLTLEKGVIELVNAIGRESGEDLTTRSQLLAWDNLPILNELKRLHPDQDPVALYEKLWGVRLIDPAGGKFTWNEQWQTQSSSAYGHPGEPLTGPETATFGGMTSGHFGLTFEDQGLRVFAEFK